MPQDDVLQQREGVLHQREGVLKCSRGLAAEPISTKRVVVLAERGAVYIIRIIAPAAAPFEYGFPHFNASPPAGWCFTAA